MDREAQTDMEMTQMSNGTDGAARMNGQVSDSGAAVLEDASNDKPDGFRQRKNEPETERLLESDGFSNGLPVDQGSSADVEAQTPKYSEPPRSAVCRVREELTQRVCGDRVPLWAVLLLLFVLIVLIIIASLALCTVIYEDEDEDFSRAQFDVARRMSGSVLLPNLNFTAASVNFTAASVNFTAASVNFTAASVNVSSERQALAARLKHQLDVLFSGSPALGRYYSTSEVYHISDDPVTAGFRLTFLVPAADRSQLSRFTLSRNMVLNVLRQFLFDQEEDASDRMFVEPASVNVTESR